MIEPSRVPPAPTKVRLKTADGRMVGTDRSVWVYRTVPLAPVIDAKSPADRLLAGEPLLAAYEEVAAMTSVRMGRRAMSKGEYRETHALLVNIPMQYKPAPDDPLAGYLKRNYRMRYTDRRMLVFGVRLRDRIGSGDLRTTAENFATSMITGVTPLSDFDDDYAKVSAALDRAGLRAPTTDEMRLADAWWNFGTTPDTPYLIHADHLHFFTSVEGMRLAQRMGPTDCDRWDEDQVIPGEHAITFAAVRDLELPFKQVTDPAVTWASHLVAGRSRVVSIRGLVEPSRVTRGELRRQRKRYIEDIQGRYEQGKMELAEQQEMLALLEQIEGFYSGGDVPPTLTEASIVVGIDGRGMDLDQAVPSWSPAKLSLLGFRQEGALQETMLCSNIRANNYLMDLPTQTVAYSGLPGLSVVGDPGGALVGFTETDRQPARVSPTAASTGDAAPLMVIPGATGSGKASHTSTIVPTPTGVTTMGALKVGDQVIGRDGKPCRVTWVSPIEEKPRSYRITFSDGQQIEADFDHQWVVSSFKERNAPRRPKHVAALERWDGAQALIEQMEALALRVGHAEREVTLHDLHALLSEQVPGVPWNGAVSLRASLDMVECPFRTEVRSVPRTVPGEIRKADPVKVYPVREALETLIATWSNLTGGNAARWGATAARKAGAASKALAETCDDQSETTAGIVALLNQHGADLPAGRGSANAIARILNKAGLAARIERREVVVPIPERTDRTTTREVRLYDLEIAIKALAIRLRQQYGDRPTTEAGERVMTTGEMLAEGIRLAQGHTNFAVRIAAPLDLPEADLPVDPYILGAWLGDGSTGNAQFTQSDAAVSDGMSDMEHLIEQAIVGGYDAEKSTSVTGQIVNVRGLKVALRQAGVLHDKHIPMAYLRASIQQRLALLQGLMDTDGSVDLRGSCELSLSDRRLASDALDLIRSLGIKASITWDQPAGYRNQAGEYIECKRRHRIHFTPEIPVFRLPRKVERQTAVLATGARETNRWNYITSVEPIAPVPMRCISVDSPDATYLVDGYVPTHNTMLGLKLCTEWAQMNAPVIVVDPKQDSDFSDVVEAHGGQVVSLDELTKADGVFDPLRFAGSKQVGIELAASMLMQINPWGSEIERARMEVPVQRAIAHGVERGATCTGQALLIAQAELPDLPPELVARVMDAAKSSVLFRACVGVDPHTAPLSVADGITLIKVGKTHLELPEPGQAPEGITQRTTVALIRMMVFGSAMALTGRNGVLVLDEAWTFLSGTGGRTAIERLGRLARSQRVLPVLLTQRVTDFVDAGLAGYISRGFILPLSDPAEALAACTLFNLDPSTERIGRITAKATIGSGTDIHGAPNWTSMRALRDPSGRVLRGTIAIYVDLAGRAVPVEVVLPPEFLELASTNPDDVRRREARKAEQAKQAGSQAVGDQHRPPLPQTGGDPRDPFAA